MKLNEIFTDELINKIERGDVRLTIWSSGDEFDIVQVTKDDGELVCDWDEMGMDEGFVFDLGEDITDITISTFSVKDVEGGLTRLFFDEVKPYNVMPQVNTIGSVITSTATNDINETMIGTISTSTFRKILVDEVDKGLASIDLSSKKGIPDTFTINTTTTTYDVMDGMIGKIGHSTADGTIGRVTSDIKSNYGQSVSTPTFFN